MLTQSEDIQQEATAADQVDMHVAVSLHLGNTSAAKTRQVIVGGNCERSLKCVADEICMQLPISCATLWTQ